VDARHSSSEKDGKDLSVGTLKKPRPLLRPTKPPSLLTTPKSSVLSHSPACPPRSESSSKALLLRIHPLELMLLDKSPLYPTRL
jgi:hypothetical protein